MNLPRTVDPLAGLRSSLTLRPAVAPPPMCQDLIHSYRCKDNSLIFVDFMTDETTAVFRSSKDGAPGAFEGA